MPTASSEEIYPISTTKERTWPVELSVMVLRPAGDSGLHVAAEAEARLRRESPDAVTWLYDVAADIAEGLEDGALTRLALAMLCDVDIKVGDDLLLSPGRPTFDVILALGETSEPWQAATRAAAEALGVPVTDCAGLLSMMGGGARG